MSDNQSQPVFSWGQWYAKLHELAEGIREAQAQAADSLSSQSDQAPAPSNKADSLSSQNLRRKLNAQ